MGDGTVSTATFAVGESIRGDHPFREVSMRTIVALLGSVVVACSDPLDSVTLDFVAEPVEAEELREWSVAHVEDGFHQVTVRRAVRVPGPCESLQAELFPRGTEFTLRVRRPAGAQNVGREGVCGYTAVMHGVPTGHYTLRVVHTQVEHGRASEVVMHHPLRVR